MIGLKLPSLKTWAVFSLLGGVLGTLNVSWYLLTPSYISHITENYDFDYVPFAFEGIQFSFLMLFIPALFSTAVLFPLFYSKIKKQFLNSRINIFIHLFNGTAFGIAASFCTAFFMLLFMATYKYLADGSDFFQMFAILVPVGTPLVGIVAIILCFPAILVSGWLFSKLTASAIKKEQEEITE